LTALLHFLKQPVLLNRRAGMPNRRQASGVQRAVLGDLVTDALLERSGRRGRELDRILRAIDQLAIQFAVGVAANSSTVRLRRVLRDLPTLERSAVEDVLVSAPDDDDRVFRRGGVQLTPEGKALLLQLTLVPVAVRHDQLARLRT
jgi:hypothetical protein